jgi:ABC-type amino acid transport system permease subunit
MKHVEIVVTNRFVSYIVPRMGILVGLDGQNRAANEFPMVNSSTMGTIAVTSEQRLVVYEAVETSLNRISNSNLLGVLMDNP